MNRVLYRCYATDGTCLYVGATTQPGVRFRKHAESKDWWCEVSTINLVHYRTGDALAAAEKAAIAAECPVYNVAHNPGRREAFLDYYDDGDPDDIDESVPGEWVIEEYEGPEIDATDCPPLQIGAMS